MGDSPRCDQRTAMDANIGVAKLSEEDLAVLLVSIGEQIGDDRDEELIPGIAYSERHHARHHRQTMDVAIATILFHCVHRRGVARHELK